MIKSILWQMSGVDQNILSQISGKWQRKYFRGAIGMLLIGLMCMVSGGYAFYVIFGSLLMALPFSVFWALIMLNLYRLVLITVGNPYIPHKPRYRFPFGAFLFRTFFLISIGLFVVKPIEMLIMAPLTSPYVDAHRAQVLAEHQTRAEQFSQMRVNKVFQEGNRALEMAEGDGFLMKRLEIMHTEFPACWLMTVGLMWVFLWPFWARVAWRNRSEYEMTRGNIEKHVVVAAYQDFRALFQQRMLELTGRDDIWEERFHDMPFGNEPIIRAEKSYMHPGSLYGWARIWAQEEGKELRK